MRFFRAWLQYPPVQVLPPFSPVAIFPALGELAAVCVASFPALGAGCRFIDKFIRKNHPQKGFPALANFESSVLVLLYQFT